MNSMHRGSHAVVLALGALCSGNAAAQILQGRVVDGEVRENPAGVPAVIVKIRDANQNPVGSGTTNQLGYYSIALGLGAKIAIYDKKGYLNRKTIGEINLAKKVQDDIILVKEGERPEYYRAVARAFNASSGRDAEQYAQIFAALPPGHKTLVADMLSPGARSALFSAEVRHRIVSRVDGTEQVKVQVDRNAGTLRLYGVAATAAAKAEAEKVAQGATQAKVVDNKIKVGNDAAVTAKEDRIYVD